MLNQVNVSGNVGSIRAFDTKSGKKKIYLSVATNDYFGGDNQTNWHNCLAFGNLVDYIEKYAKPGTYAEVCGRLFYDSETKLPTIIANTVTIIKLDKKEDKKETGHQSAGQVRDNGY